MNPLLLAQEILARGHLITQVNYYTARISVRSNDPEAPARQVAYLKALESVPNVRIHEGNFMVSKVLMALSEPLETRPRDYQWAMPPPNLVQVVKTEEKGSDVNLAAHLVQDAFKDAFDVAVVLSNDTDLVEPIRIVKEEVGKRVGPWYRPAIRQPRLPPQPRSICMSARGILPALSFRTPSRLRTVPLPISQPHGWPRTSARTASPSRLPLAMSGVYLTRDAETPALARFYRMLMVPTLFGEWVLLREWGRIVAGGTVRADTFPNAGAAVLALQAITREKLKRGYRSLA